MNIENYFPGCSVVKNPPAKAVDTKDMGSLPGLGWSPGKGNGHPLQYSCLENPIDRGTLWAIVHGVTKSQTWLGDWTLRKMKQTQNGLKT